MNECLTTRQHKKTDRLLGVRICISNRKKNSIRIRILITLQQGITHTLNPQPINIQYLCCTSVFIAFIYLLLFIVLFIYLF